MTRLARQNVELQNAEAALIQRRTIREFRRSNSDAGLSELDSAAEGRGRGIH